MWNIVSWYTVGLICYTNRVKHICMNLKSYIDAHRLTYEAAASLIGNVSRSAVIKWCRGERVPMPDQMRRIHAVTDGSVCPNDFILGEDASCPR